jgi:uncharacterized membrane protein YkoI
MKRVLSTICTCAFGLFTSFAAETPVKMSDLPAAVQKTVQEQTKGAQVKGISKEVEKGKTQYEVETMVNGKSRDMIIDTKGAVVEVEEETTMDSIPAAAKGAIEKKAGGGKITKVETLTKGQTVMYEAAITTKAGKKTEIQVGADGSVQK